jgi:hypothetical protein
LKTELESDRFSKIRIAALTICPPQKCAHKRREDDVTCIVYACLLRQDKLGEGG